MSEYRTTYSIEDTRVELISQYHQPHTLCCDTAMSLPVNVSVVTHHARGLWRLRVIPHGVRVNSYSAARQLAEPRLKHLCNATGH